MAIYHLSMKPVTRASGRSAVAAAAYRSVTRLVNERDGLAHDYTRKGGIEHAQIVVPEGQGADWALDREALWNAAEFAEKRKDARVAREFEVALPHELTGEERLELVRSFSQGLAERYGVAVDFALHVPDRDMDVRNHHAHILITTRPEGTRAAMAHRRVDVRRMNDDIRDALKAGGRLSGEEATYDTELGERAFTAGDRIVFLQNDRGLDVKNGTLGTVERVEAGGLVARIDGPGGRGETRQGRSVEIDASAYKAFDHGYATTIHKTQGATVDRAYVLASNTGT